MTDLEKARANEKLLTRIIDGDSEIFIFPEGDEIVVYWYHLGELFECNGYKTINHAFAELHEWFVAEYAGSDYV